MLKEPKHNVEFDSELWGNQSLWIDENGHVDGSMHVFGFVDGYDVTIGVFSYDYDRHGETRTNHVPQVVVSTTDGSIVAEPHAHDSNNPVQAIKNARDAAEHVIENPDEFV
jgi:hypothetical protein